MAAAIIPLVATLAPALIDLITRLVHPKAIAVENSLGSGTGPVKFADVFVSVMQALVNAHAAGQIDTVPDDASLKIIIQAVVTSMKLSGVLNGPSTIPATNSANSSQTIALAPGQKLTVTA